MADLSKHNWTFDNDTARDFNRLAREQMKEKILADVLMDMEICKLEGWDVTEFPLEIKQMMEDVCYGM